MSTRSSRVLHRTFLTCTLFVLLLVPQIGATETALATKATTKFPTPVSQAIANPYCLSLSMSHTFPGSIVSVANPPGQTVSFGFVIVLANNCGTTLMSGATVTTTVNIMSVQLTFTSPRYGSFEPNIPQSRHFRVDSVNAQMEQEDRQYTLEDVNIDPFLQEQIQQAGDPFAWEGPFFLSGIHFSGRIRHYASPHHISVFLLKSERTILMGYAYGPSCDELVHLLEGLQVISRRDEVIRQYEEELLP